MNETEILFTSLLNCDRVSLYLDKERRLTREQSLFLAEALKRRMSGEPLEYILGNCEFMGREFLVNSAVLIPRPETEILVETAVRYARIDQQKPVSDMMILDLGTGSGNIAVSLASFLPGARFVAIDISEDALSVARRNAAVYGCSERIRFVCNNLMAGCGIAEASCSMIISNPPYIVSGEIQGLQREVLREPRAALDGGEDGLMFYRTICGQALRFLRDDGVLIMEMGFGQCRRITEIFRQSGFSVREVVRDYNGIERVIVAGKGISTYG
jgi:release factor glutamine methyltransferase